MVYVYYEKDKEKFNKDMVFYCNGCGELHYDGQYDIEEEDLPEALRRAYRKLWSDSTGSYCYLCQFRGEDYIALCNEFACEEYDYEITETKLRARAIRNATKIAGLLEKDAVVLVDICKTAFLNVAVYVLLDAYTSYSYFETVAETLHKFIYEEEDVPFYLVPKKSIKKKEELASMILDLKEDEELVWHEYDSYDKEENIAYCASKVVWNDSCLALIGGFGGETKCCWLPGASVAQGLSCNKEDEEKVRALVTEFYQLIHLADEYIEVEKEKRSTERDLL